MAGRRDGWSRAACEGEEVDGREARATVARWQGGARWEGGESYCSQEERATVARWEGGESYCSQVGGRRELL